MSEVIEAVARGLITETPANFIDGEWATEPETMPAVNPATGETIALLPKSSRATASGAVAAAKAAQPAWGGQTAWERAALCVRLAEAIDVAAERIGRVLSLEQGKPLAQGIGEVRKAADGFRMAAEQVKYLGGETLPVETPGMLVITRRRPRGVYAVITPWNFPVNIPVEYIAPALATGNAVVWVPAPTTALVAVEFMRVLAGAGLPRGILNLVVGMGAEVGDEIVAHPDTQGIGFTGSTATGRRIAERGAGKPMLLELGGNGPVIVRADANLEKAAAAAAGGAFFNSGQVCAATGRVLAHSSVVDELSERMVAIAREQALGDPFHQGTTMGPLNNPNVLEKVIAHVDGAVAAGATLLVGGRNRPDLGSPLYYEATVLRDVTPDMPIAREETFGPVAPIIACADDDALMQVATDTSYGLSMGIFTADVSRAMAMANELSAGIVNINGGSTYWEIHLPFGGGAGTVSGLGRIGGRHTLEAMTDLRMTSLPLPA